MPIFYYLIPLFCGFPRVLFIVPRLPEENIENFTFKSVSPLTAPFSSLPRLPEGDEYMISSHGSSYLVQTSTEYLKSTMLAYAPLLRGLSGNTIPVLLYGQIALYVQKIGSRFRRSHYVDLAVEATRSFVWPAEVASHDYELLERAGSLLDLIHQYQSTNRQLCFNSSRVEACLQGVSNYDVVLELAISGIVIDPISGFRPQSSIPPIRPLMRTLQNCQRTHALKAWRAGRVLILPHTKLTTEDLSGVHINPTHWTPKPNLEEKVSNVLGRPLIDPSNGPTDQVLNTEEARLAAIARYGKVDDPLIDDIITTWFDFSRRKGIPLDQCFLWKEDIENAFGQLPFQARSALLMTAAVDEDFLVFNLYGTFGWTGLPMAWGAVGRAIREAASSRIKGCLHGYVDDFMGLAPQSDAEHDQGTFQNLARGVLGDSALNLAKSVPPSSQGDVIGWYVDLLSGTIRPSDRGIDKLLFSFFSFDPRVPLSLRLYQVLASLAERYSRALRGMRAMVAPLHHMVSLAGTSSSSFWKRKPTSQARFCIDMWRIVTLSLWADRERYAVPLYVFDHGSQQGVIRGITDASPWKLAAAILDDSGRVKVYTTMRLPFHAPGGDTQNLKEFLGYILFLLLVHFTVPRAQLRRVAWVGDNTSALSWADDHKVRSTAGQFANLIESWTLIYADMWLTKTDHHPGHLMGVIDDLSRDRPVPSLSGVPYVDLHYATLNFPDPLRIILVLLVACMNSYVV